MATGTVTEREEDSHDDQPRTPSPSRSSSPPFFKAQIFLSHILFPDFVGCRTTRIGLDTFLKFGHQIDITEADTLEYVRKHTSIPVPKVRHSWSSNGITYIVMDLVKGVELKSEWPKMSETTRRRVIDQLKEYVTELRSLKTPTEGIIASVTGGPLRDISRVGSNRFGPFNNQNNFHQFLRTGVSLDKFNPRGGGHWIITAHRQQYAIKFTHGDLTPRNIMVKKDGTITAIVDWDSAGWFPEYWEYTKAKFALHAPDSWMSSIGDITGDYEKQLAGERNLQNVCGIKLTRSYSGGKLSHPLPLKPVEGGLR